MFERFTDRARRVLVLAQQEALLLDHNFIGTEHFLLGLLLEGDGVAAKALESSGITLEMVRQKIEETVESSTSPNVGTPPFTPRAKKVLELSLREALQLGHNYIGTEHMLLGILREGNGVGAQVLIALGADLTQVRQQVISILAGGPSAEAAERTGTRTADTVTARSGSRDGPCCPACRGPLEDHVSYRVLSVRAATAGEALDVTFVYCLRCGSAVPMAAGPAQA